MAPAACVQDHVILLLSTQDFETLPSWLTDNFNVLEGGNHTGSSLFFEFSLLLTDPSGQPSRNKLIVFKDGTYLELFNWIEPPREPNAWADSSPGLIDCALTTLHPSTAESVYEEVAARLQSLNVTPSLSVKYEQPEAGGRIRKDGVQVKWKLSRPIPASEASSSTDAVSRSGHRKDLPFFTHDVTDRNVRIPFDDESKTTHPCGAVGISTVDISFPEAQYLEYVKLYKTLLGISAKPLNEPSNVNSHEFKVESPVPGSKPSRIVLHSIHHQAGTSEQKVPGIGICGLRLALENRQGHGAQALGSDGIASTLSLEW